MRTSVSEKSGRGRERTNARAMRRRSPQKNHATARTVPVWMAASKERPKRSWSMPRKYWLRSRCPELETGRNSVRPCTTPKKAAWRSSSTPRSLAARRCQGHTLGGLFSGVFRITPLLGTWVNSNWLCFVVALSRGRHVDVAYRYCYNRHTGDGPLL